MSLRVLVVDDQLPFRRAARSVLRSSFEFELVGEARSGEVAVAMVRSLRPDVVVLDIKMAGVGGIEAARSIATASPETLTILVSTYREEELPAGVRTCGAAGYIHKSEFGAPALRALLETARCDRPGTG